MRFRTCAVTLFVCALLPALLAGCGKPLELRMRLEPGARHEFDIRNDVKVSGQGMAAAMVEPQQTSQRLVFDIQDVAADGVATVKMKSDMDLGFMGGMMEGMGPSMGDIGKIEISFQLGPDGSIHGVSGMEEVVKRLTDSLKSMFEEQMKGIPEEARAQMGDMSLDNMVDGMTKMLKDTMSNEATKEQLQAQAFHYYPTGPIKVGTTWTRDSRVKQPFPMLQSGSYKVTACGKGVTNIEYTSTLSTDGAGEMDLGFMKTSMQLSGSAKGVVQIDEATGWLKVDSSSMNLEVKMQMGPVAMPMTIEGQTYVQAM